MILPAPAERLPFGVFDAARIHAALLQNVFVLGGEIFAHHSHHADSVEIAGGQREIRRRAAQDVFHFAGRAGDGIECNRTYDDNAHAFLAFRYLSRISFNF